MRSILCDVPDRLCITHLNIEVVGMAWTRDVRI